MINEARQNLEYEERDVADLKKFTWTSIKARLKGDRYERLSNESKEYAFALNHHEDLIKQQQAIKKLVNVAKKQWVEVQRLVNKKKDMKQDLKKFIMKLRNEISNPISDHLIKNDKAIKTKLNDVGLIILDLRTNQYYLQNALSFY